MNLRNIVLVVSALSLSASLYAADLVWDGKTYLDIGLQMGSDTTLILPEPVEISSEIPSAFESIESQSDPRIMVIRPAKAHEQRVTFVGTKSKTVYLARFSTRSTYAPLYRIKDGTAVEAARLAATTKLSPTSLMKSMMAGQQVNGVSAKKRKQDLIAGSEYKITATEVWETPSMTGIIATATLQPGLEGITIRPSDVSLKVPSYGNLRMMGADRWDLDSDVPYTTVYFVFTR